MAKEKKVKTQEEKSANVSDFVTFSRVMMGYKPTEVNDYVEVLNNNLTNVKKVFDVKCEEFKNDIELLTCERDGLKVQNDKYVQEIAELNNELTILRSTDAKAKATIEENETLVGLVAQLTEQIDSYSSVVEEKKVLNNTIKELNMKLDVLTEQYNKVEKDNSELREQNKKQAYNSAEEKKRLEEAFINEKIRVKQIVEVHSYHIRQSKALMDDLTKQFNQSLQQLEKIEKE